jgi:uncharacterized membrane protein YdbT with pleckstrin-like domain
MGYVNNNLISNENIIYEAKVHWFIFVPSIVYFAIGIYLISKGTESAGAFGVFVILFSIISFVKAVITKTTTELAVTSKRVIAKIGLIRRSTVELNHSKVESFNVEQSIFGRIFGFGTLVLNGTGGGKTPIPNIDAPLEFRKNAMESIDPTQE